MKYYPTPNFLDLPPHISWLGHRKQWRDQECARIYRNARYLAKLRKKLNHKLSKCREHSVLRKVRDILAK